MKFQQKQVLIEQLVKVMRRKSDRLTWNRHHYCTHQKEIEFWKSILSNASAKDSRIDSTYLSQNTLKVR